MVKPAVGELRVTSPEGNHMVAHMGYLGCPCNSEHKITKVTDKRIQFMVRETPRVVLEILKRKNQRRQDKGAAGRWSWGLTYF